MRAVYSILLFTSAVACASPASDPPAPDPAPPPAVEFPDLPVVVPNPVPPGAMPTLTAGVIYPVVCRQECVFRAYPAALVTITKEVVPSGETLRLRGAFIGGEKEKRFKGPVTVFLVEAAGVGRVELVATPLGLKTEKEIVTKTVEVDSGQGPQPPPDPPKPPTPQPNKPVIGIDGVSVLLVYETADLAKYTKEQAAIPYSTKLYKYLDSVCAPAPDGQTRAWRIWDKDIDGYLDSKVFGDAMKRPRASVPWVVISSPKGNYEGPWPADADALIALVKKTIGG